jgi:hypothetical protein
MKEQNIKRFDIYLYNFGKKEGSIQSGMRPVLVIQDDRMNENSPTTIVAAITTAIVHLLFQSTIECVLYPINITSYTQLKSKHKWLFFNDFRLSKEPEIRFEYLLNNFQDIMKHMAKCYNPPSHFALTIRPPCHGGLIVFFGADAPLGKGREAMRTRRIAGSTHIECHRHKPGRSLTSNIFFDDRQRCRKLTVRRETNIIIYASSKC